ncbi:hypothetical protein KEJ33_03315 [Candidatus Bathyarchaeota archaeon]|nr:hypothetical protein [Candidatus Bathyarchaeota archaeon]
MVNGEIRLGISGLIMFSSRLLSIGTGLAFTLMITRSITAEAFGVYGNVSDILSYFILASGIFPFWATRFIARNHAGSSVTVVFSNLLVAVPFTVIYILLLPVVMSLFHVTSEFTFVYAIISVQILEIYLQSGLEATLYAKKPQSIGIGIIIFEVSKVCLGYALIFLLNMGLAGAVLSVIIALSFQIFYYLKLTAPIFSEKINFKYVKEWAKASPFNLFGTVGQKLADLVLFFLFLYGGKIARGYYGAALTIASVVGYSSSIGYALYPRLLSKSKPEDVTFSIKLVSMFAIPMAFGAVVMGDSFLVILRSEYAIAKPVLTLLSLDLLLLCFSSIFETVITGAEKLDAEAAISWKKLAKSNLFISLALPYIKALFILPTIYYILNFLVVDALDAALYVGLATLIIDFALVSIRYFIANRSLQFKMPIKHIAKYVFASIAMASLLYIIPHPTRLSLTAALTLLGACVYFIILLVVDNESRTILKKVTNELQRIFEIQGSA